MTTEHAMPNPDDDPHPDDPRPLTPNDSIETARSVDQWLRLLSRQRKLPPNGDGDTVP